MLQRLLIVTEHLNFIAYDFNRTIGVVYMEFYEDSYYDIPERSVRSQTPGKPQPSAKEVRAKNTPAPVKKQESKPSTTKAGRPPIVEPGMPYTPEVKETMDRIIRESGYRKTAPEIPPPILNWFKGQGYTIGGTDDKTYEHLWEYFSLYIVGDGTEEPSRLTTGPGSCLTNLNLFRKACPPAHLTERQDSRMIQDKLIHLHSLHSEQVFSTDNSIPICEYEAMLADIEETPLKAVIWLMMITGNRCSNIGLLRGHQIFLGTDFIRINWRIRKAVKKRNYRVNVVYKFEWIGLPPPMCVQTFLSEGNKAATELVLQKNTPPPMFASILNKKNQDQFTSAVTLQMKKIKNAEKEMVYPRWFTPDLILYRITDSQKLRHGSSGCKNVAKHPPSRIFRRPIRFRMQSEKHRRSGSAFRSVRARSSRMCKYGKTLRVCHIPQAQRDQEGNIDS
jgi:hypothetical protein